MLLDFLKCAHDAEEGLSACRYVGMGGTTFYDFHLLHRFLGLKKMVSLERDEKIIPRVKFNCPFKFIKVTHRTAATFLAADRDKSRTIYWFDYDDGIGSDVTADITSLGTRVTVGGFAFVTVCGHPPGALERESRENRLAYFHEHMGEFSVGLKSEDMDTSAFPNTVHKVLAAAFRNAFAARTDGRFHALFQIQYKDTLPMITVGGCLTSEEASQRVVNRVKTDLPFLFGSSPYMIRRLNLTERERALFDIAATRDAPNSVQAKALLKIGFRTRDFDAYRDLIRFLPRYHESII